MCAHDSPTVAEPAMRRFLFVRWTKTAAEGAQAVIGQTPNYAWWLGIVKSISAGSWACERMSKTSTPTGKWRGSVQVGDRTIPVKVVAQIIHKNPKHPPKVIFIACWIPRSAA